MEPLEIALTLVVVASAGGDRLEVAFPSVNCREGVLLVFGLAGFLTDETTSEAVLLAEEILSRAIWVMGAVLRGQVLLYQLYIASAESAVRIVIKRTDRLGFSVEFATTLVSGVAIDLVGEGSSWVAEFGAPSRLDVVCSCEPFDAI